MSNRKINQIARIKEKVSPPKVMDLIVAQEENLFVFLSIDICNSTLMKKEIKQWFDATKILYSVRFEPMHFWKYNGDEVLYAEPFSNLNTLLDIVTGAYSHITRLQKEICYKMKEYDSGSMFKLKGSLWLARTAKDGNETTKNVFVNSTRVDEFLGVNIDEGFRLSKKVSGGKLVIDPKIVLLLQLAFDINTNNQKRRFIPEEDEFFQFCRNININQKEKIKKILECISFVNYTNLKGIWQNRGYPLFWYFEKESDFDYDEKVDNNFVFPKKLLSEDWLSRLETIYEKTEEKEEFQNILNIIANGNPNNIYTSDSFSRLYYSIACINPTTKKVLVAQRSTERRHLKNVWEFGMFKHSSLSIIESLEKIYKEEFGLDIEIVTDNETERNIVPLHFCTVYRNGQAHNSILCMAIIKSEEGMESDEQIINSIRRVASSDRYHDFRFVNQEEAKSFKSITMNEISEDSWEALNDRATAFDDDSAIMYFKDSVCKVISYYEKMLSGKSWYE